MNKRIICIPVMAVLLFLLLTAGGNGFNNPDDKIRITRDIPYIKNSTEPRNFLDIYHPKDGKNLPVLVFIHGGGWKHGDKSTYQKLGKDYAEKNFVTVIINYRLSPGSKHPAHVQDCAAAVAWVFKNIGEYGGNPRRIIIMGHSAGAHLAALLTLDSKYLGKYIIGTRRLAGVICISGVYDIKADGEKENFPGYQFPLEKMYNDAFGSDREAWQQASPINYSKGEIPPLLILYGKREAPYMKKQSANFYASLKEKSAPVEIVEIPYANHISIISDAGKSDHRTFRAVKKFIESIIN
jgi:arylformamidase